MRKKKTPEELAAEAEQEDLDDFTSKHGTLIFALIHISKYQMFIHWTNKTNIEQKSPVPFSVKAFKITSFIHQMDFHMRFLFRINPLVCVCKCVCARVEAGREDFFVICSLMSSRVRVLNTLSHEGNRINILILISVCMTCIREDKLDNKHNGTDSKQ